MILATKTGKFDERVPKSKLPIWECKVCGEQFTGFLRMKYHLSGMHGYTRGTTRLVAEGIVTVLVVG